MAHLGSHICINANDDTYSSSSSSNGPLPGMVLWSSNVQTGPTPSQDKPKFGNFEDFEGLTGLTSFKRFLDTPVQPVRADQ